MKNAVKLQTPDPDEPGKDPKEPWRPTDPEPPPIREPEPGPGEPDPYPVTDPMPGEPNPFPTPPEPIPEFPPDVKYGHFTLEDADYGSEGDCRDDQPQYNALKQRPVAEFLYRLM